MTDDHQTTAIAEGVVRVIREATQAVRSRAAHRTIQVFMSACFITLWLNMVLNYLEGTL